jgi:dipeptidase D
MMKVIERFKALSRIPHCSREAGAMRDYLVATAAEYGYTVHADGAGNLLCGREGAKVTLQAHYDMVCIGRAPELEFIEEEGWLRARESTLGADNGIAMAMMLTLMEEGAPVECLFTADEEVGLLGARDLSLPLKALPMLNLDSEEEGLVTIGCAGGVDILAQKPVTFERRECYGYRVAIGPLPGGHSGVDIDKNIPNAIMELAALLEGHDVMLEEIGGGERRNAIPRSAVAVVASEKELPELSHAEPLGKGTFTVMRESAEILEMLRRFAQGVRCFDEGMGIVHTSINLALLSSDAGSVHVQLSARAMETESLRELESGTAAYFEEYGCRVRSEGFYAPWSPQQTPFAETVLASNREQFKTAAFSAIHAGLECGVIKERYPHLDMASIGPNIVAPHSIAERVEIASVDRVFNAVKAVIGRL